jgi:hypothetical protein
MALASSLLVAVHYFHNFDDHVAVCGREAISEQIPRLDYLHGSFRWCSVFVFYFGSPSHKTEMIT